MGLSIAVVAGDKPSPVYTSVFSIRFPRTLLPHPNPLSGNHTRFAGEGAIPIE